MKLQRDLPMYNLVSRFVIVCIFNREANFQEKIILLVSVTVKIINNINIK